MYRIHAPKIDNSVNLAGALSQIASFKPRRDALQRALEKCRSEDDPQAASNADLLPSALAEAHADESSHKRRWLWLDHAVVALWIMVLLSIVAYAVIEGETVMAALDGLDLVATYSLQP
jgi:hypothetical protein